MAAGQVSTKQILITGVPGVGKTTLMMKIQQNLVKQGVHCSGFITEEVRTNGRRIGFDVVTTDGQRGQLARISDFSNQIPGSRQREYKVGQYSVNLVSFEQTALPALKFVAKELKNGHPKQLYLIDEIGKMELFSQSFVQAVSKLISHPDATIVATIPAPKGKPIPFVEQLRSSKLSQVFEINHQNRDSILNDILMVINTSLEAHKSR